MQFKSSITILNSDRYIVGQEDKDDDVATARSQISEPDSLSHIVSQVG